MNYVKQIIDNDLFDKFGDYSKQKVEKRFASSIILNEYVSLVTELSR